MEQRQPSKGVLIKRCSENMQQVYWKTSMPKFDFSKIALNFIKITLWHGCSPVNLLLNFRTTFLKGTSGGLLLKESAVLSSKFFLGNPTLLDFVCKQRMGLIEKRQIVIEQLNQ